MADTGGLPPFTKPKRLCLKTNCYNSLSSFRAEKTDLFFSEFGTLHVNSKVLLYIMWSLCCRSLFCVADVNANSVSKPRFSLLFVTFCALICIVNHIKMYKDDALYTSQVIYDCSLPVWKQIIKASPLISGFLLVFFLISITVLCLIV